LLVSFIPLACDGSTSPDDTGESEPRGLEGTLTFTYAGARAGAFSAKGAPSPVLNPAREFAAAYRFGLRYTLRAFMPTNGERGTEISILLSGELGPGTYQGQCPAVSPTRCIEMGWVAFNTLPGQYAESRNRYAPMGGSLTISDTTRGRVRGTFSLVTAPAFGDTTGLTLREGQFDLARANP
jgi:hypothetical protein